MNEVLHSYINLKIIPSLILNIFLKNIIIQLNLKYYYTIIRNYNYNAFP